ncbi:acyl-ACP--UDP-N-acetylglucosamine O-acyltransferase [Candidatus Poribacteria bacterium]|nr:acyl-ACP--UDP-N-acetylglucosamine O-acyltransferase [Candidatus Poribacteria bacterium]
MPDIHSSAIVSPNAILADDVQIGPFSIIDDDVTIGSGSRIHEHVKVARHTTIGSGCELFFGAVVGHVSVDLKYRGGICRTDIGDRTVLREYVTISASSFDGGTTSVGSRCLLMNWSNVAHDCVIGDGVIMANFATLGGHVQIEGNCRIGAHSAFHQFVRVGRGSMSGACSKFVQDLPPYTVADGHPARLRGLNLLGRGTAQSHPMRDVPEESVRRLKQAYRILFRNATNLSVNVARVRDEVEDDAYVSHLLEFIESSKRGVCR